MESIKPYFEYETRPRFLGDAEEKVKDAGYSSAQKFDLVQPTIFGLLEDLVPGSDLMERFLKEQENLQSAWFYYPRNKHVVRFAPAFWHRIALVVRNSTLLRDREMKIAWGEIRAALENAVVAVAGCSVGNSAAHAIAGDLRPLHLKIADWKNYNINNANRVRLTYADFGVNKAVVTAEQIHAVDPFMKISVFSEGVHPGNVEDFIDGSAARQEQKASAIIEETDDPDAKIFMREQARRHRVPVVMVTDIGSAIQLDVRRFDVSDSLPLAAAGLSDEELFAKRDEWKKDLASRDKFYDFAWALIGRNYEKAAEFRRIIDKADPPLFAGVPQLGSTAMAAGGIAAEAVARLLLGFRLPERMFINKHTGETLVQGEVL